MDNVQLVMTAVVHTVYGHLRSAFDHRDPESDRDRGSSSLDNVLWFVAVGAAVAVIAAIVFATIKDKADDPINTPTVP